MTEEAANWGGLFRSNNFTTPRRANGNETDANNVDIRQRHKLRESVDHVVSDFLSQVGPQIFSFSDQAGANAHSAPPPKMNPVRVLSPIVTKNGAPRRVDCTFP